MKSNKQFLIIRMLNRLLKKGYPLSEALILMIDVNGIVINKIIHLLEQGHSLSEVFKQLKFKRFVYETLKIGEVSNKLNEVIALIENQFIILSKMKAQFNKVLLYPCILFIISLFSFEFIRLHLFPVISTLLNDFNYSNNQFLIFIAFNLLKMIGLVFLLLLFLVLKFPFLKNIFYSVKIVQSLSVSYNMTILMTCGNSLNDSIRLLSDHFNKQIYRFNIIEQALFSESFQNPLFSAFTTTFIKYIRIGVDSNDLLTVLQDYNDLYLDILIDRLTKLTYIIQFCLFSILSINIFLIYYLIMIPMLNISQTI